MRLTERKGGFQYGFVMEFQSAQDRDYYVKEDPDHHAFVKKATSGFVEDIRVVDFEPGVLV